MRLDLNAVAENVRRAETEDLLDRITVYRADMEPAAVELVIKELLDRGVSGEDVSEHGRAREEAALRRGDGWAERCSFCARPAVVTAVGWHRLWGRLPVFPRRFRYCDTHRAESPS